MNDVVDMHPVNAVQNLGQKVLGQASNNGTGIIGEWDMGIRQWDTSINSQKIRYSVLYVTVGSMPTIVFTLALACFINHLLKAQAIDMLVCALHNH